MSEEINVIPLFYLEVMQMVARIPSHDPCPHCEMYGQVQWPSWKNPRPCDVCGGVGQLNHKKLPPQASGVQVVII